MGKEKESTVKKILTGIIIVGIFAFAFSTCSDEESKFDPQDFAEKAHVISQQFVSDNLKAPATADYPLTCNNTFYLKDSTFMVKACVDSQNEFGAKVRSDYECKLKYKGGDWADRNNWELLLLNVFPN